MDMLERGPSYFSERWLVIDDKYLCTWSIIGSGTSGTVYRGFSTKGEMIAVKCINVGRSKMNRIEEFAGREVSLVPLMGKHPNLIHYFSTFVCAFFCFCVFDMFIRIFFCQFLD
jgi:hypothetical protein